MPQFVNSKILNKLPHKLKVLLQALASPMLHMGQLGLSISTIVYTSVPVDGIISLCSPLCGHLKTYSVSVCGQNI
jgi:hypothetical protein